jgi:GNAT superfamily N-acetyltransferase
MTGIMMSSRTTSIGPGEPVQGFAAVDRLHHVMALLRERGAEDRSIESLVIDDEDAATRGHQSAPRSRGRPGRQRLGSGSATRSAAPAHRRRGAGRAVLTAALHAVATRLDRPPSVCFWSTPLGRPMYESIGFVVIDDVEVWTLGASDQDMDAVGAG